MINEHLLKAELALNDATADNVIGLCRNYLHLLAEYRDHLRELRGIPEINLAQASALGRELVEQARKAVLASVEITVREYNRTEALLGSFVSITNYQAAETFNYLEYKGAVNWKASSAGVHRILPTGSGETAEFRRTFASSAIAVRANESATVTNAATTETIIDQLTVEEAVDTAGRLRREAYVNHKITFLK